MHLYCESFPSLFQTLSDRPYVAFIFVKFCVQENLKCDYSWQRAVKQYFSVVLLFIMNTVVLINFYCAVVLLVCN